MVFLKTKMATRFYVDSLAFDKQFRLFQYHIKNRYVHSYVHKTVGHSVKFARSCIFQQRGYLKCLNVVTENNLVPLGTFRCRKFTETAEHSDIGRFSWFHIKFYPINKKYLKLSYKVFITVLNTKRYSFALFQHFCVYRLYVGPMSGRCRADIGRFSWLHIKRYLINKKYLKLSYKVF